MDYLNPLERDYQRLAEVAAGHPGAKVPTCPEWTMNDLVTHLSMVYLHKTEAMRRNAQPDPWPPTDLPTETPLERLHRAYGELTAEFAARGPGSPAYTWHEPDQTVGFWMRRMAQETVIHRIDAELAAGVESLPVPDELALDGIDEVLRLFLAYGSVAWSEDFADVLPEVPGGVVVSAGERHWLVSWSRDGVMVRDGDGPAPGRISGAPEPMLRWLWRRGEGPVTVTGDHGQVTEMRELMRVATQ